jgi:hypothetical protein
LILKAQEKYLGLFYQLNTSMRQLIRCYTLFNITQTGVLNRRPTTLSDPAYDLAKKMQCNFDTIIQVLSLRCQPEDISSTKTKTDSRGTWYYFDFTAPESVFSDNYTTFGALLDDCQNVPMLVTDIFNEKALNSLGKKPNIKFEVKDD